MTSIYSNRVVGIKFAIITTLISALAISSSLSLPRQNDTGEAFTISDPCEHGLMPPSETIDWEETLLRSIAGGNDNLAKRSAVELGIDYDDMIMLARIMQSEAGPNWEDFPILVVGEVVLNRVDSPEFPSTLQDVLYQTGPIQYEPVWQNGWEDISPSERHIRLAYSLLKGYRPLGDRSVVFQALFHQGSGDAYWYKGDGDAKTTYFCWTSRPELYV